MQFHRKKPHNGGSRRKRRSLNRLGKTFGLLNESVVQRLLTSVGFEHHDYRPFFAPRLYPTFLDDKVLYTVPDGYEAVYDKNESIPASMESGTCTPFLCWKEMYSNRLERGKINDVYGGVQALFIHDEPSLNDKLVDISVGGRGEEAHKVSLHLVYMTVVINEEYQCELEKALERGKELAEWARNRGDASIEREAELAIRLSRDISTAIANVLVDYGASGGFCFTVYRGDAYHPIEQLKGERISPCYCYGAGSATVEHPEKVTPL